MAKKLVVNCVNCDTRKALAENYAQYDSIVINAATALTSADGKAFIHAMPITMNCANVLETEEDVDMRTINGRGEIKSSDCVPDKKLILCVNGSLTIQPNTQKYLEKCVSIIVNGSAVYPESISAYLGGLKVSGSVCCYPDGAILLKRNAVIDHLFTLRAKNNLYWSAKRMVMVDPELDPEALRAKGATFASENVIIAQSKVEALIDLIDEKAEICIVPDGTAVILDDVTLDSATLRRYGTKLYVSGDVTVPAEDDCLDSLEYLVVQGDGKVPQERKEKFLDVLTDMTGELTVMKAKGAVLANRPYLKITKWMLEQQPMGLDVSECMVVKIDEDVSKEFIIQRLHIDHCGMVQCSAEQQDAVSMICADVGKIETKADEKDTGIGDTVKSAFEGLKNAVDTKVINAVDYVM